MNFYFKYNKQKIEAWIFNAVAFTHSKSSYKTFRKQKRISSARVEQKVGRPPVEPHQVFSPLLRKTVSNSSDVSMERTWATVYSSPQISFLFLFSGYSKVKKLISYMLCNILKWFVIHTEVRDQLST